MEDYSKAGLPICDSCGGRCESDGWCVHCGFHSFPHRTASEVDAVLRQNRLVRGVVGALVHYWPVPGDVLCHGGEQPLAAMIVHVLCDDRVNLVVFDAEGVSLKRLDVTFRQPHEPKPIQSSYCELPGFVQDAVVGRALDYVT